MTCRSCKEEHRDDALVCPHCSRRTREGERMKARRELKSAAIRIVFVIAVILTMRYWLGPFSTAFGQVLGNSMEFGPDQRKPPKPRAPALPAAPKGREASSPGQRPG